MRDTAPMTTDTRSRSSKRRSAARLGAVQALYQMDLAQTDLSDILAEFPSHRLGGEIDGEQYEDADEVFFRDIVTGVVRSQKTLDPQIDEVLAKGWTLSRLDSILRAILRAGAYELQARMDVPYRVVINEYIDVANAFFEDDEPKFVNGALDRLARALRSTDDRVDGNK